MVTYVEGEQGFDMPFVVKKRDGTAFSLSGYTLTLYMWKRGETTCVVNGGSMTPDVVADGTCHYTVAVGVLAESGYYEWVIKLSCIGVIRKAYGSDYIRVRDGQPC